MTTTSYAIWVSKNSKDQGFTVWASPAPNYSIPQTLEEGITKVKEFMANDDFLPGTGTWLSGFKSEREMILGQMSAEGVITWVNPEWAGRVIEQEKTADDLAWEEACKVDDEAWQNSQAKTVEQIAQSLTKSLPTVRNTVEGKTPEYLKPLFILSTMTYQTEKGISYRLAVVNKDSSTATAKDSTYLVLNERNRYKGFADSELRATELAEFIIY